VTSQENTMTTNHTSTSRQKLLSAKFVAKAIIAALALAGSDAAFAPAAQAQRLDPPGPDGTSLDYACYGTQTDYVDGVAEFKTAYPAGDQAGMDAASKKLNGAEDDWKNICEGVYGSLSIAYRVPTRETDAGPVTPAPKPGATAIPHPGSNTLAR
jgi:hypothetical protein